MKKKILVISPTTLFPTVMASQVRVLDMVKTLSVEHEVDIIVLIKTEQERELSRQLEQWCSNVFVIFKPNRSAIAQKVYGFLGFAIEKMFLRPFEIYYPTFPTVINKINSILKSNKYDIIQIEHWWQANIFKSMPADIVKVVDAHDILHLKRKHTLESRNVSLSKFQKRWLKNYQKLEMSALHHADAIISISDSDYAFYKQALPEKNHYLVHMGQNLDDFKSIAIENPDYILFYGSMGSVQNVNAFWRFWHKIFPQIQQETASKVLVVGANPPQDILQLDNGNDVRITGYVKDVREYLARAKVAILPLDGAGGFRSRVVELLAIGIPVIGTANALDCIGLTNNVHGFITDSDNEMAEYCLKLLSDKILYNKVSQNAKAFVQKRYSLENTYFKLSRYYYDL